MILGILQLSDIHFFSKGDNPIEHKVERIAAAFCSQFENIDGCIILVSGDIANWGLESDFSIAVNFFETLKGHLISKLKLKEVYFCAVPGNHDCLIEEELTREWALEKVTKEWPSLNPAIVKMSLGAQDYFFDFLEQMCGMHISNDDRMFYTVDVEISGKHIFIGCINTAWISQKKEVEGTLYFPIASIPLKKPNKADLFLTTFHHPYNWLESTNAREFRGCVQKVSDIIFTGHEHGNESYLKQTRLGERLLYIEGGVLQDRNAADNSSFNAIALDLDKHLQRIVQFEFDGEIYSPNVGSDQDWQPYQINTLQGIRDFNVKLEFDKWLNDPGMVLEQRGRGRLFLRDVFRYPHLIEKLPRGINGPTIPGASLNHIIQQNSRLLITGADKAGKTSIAKILYHEFVEKGLIPVMLDGNRVRPYGGDQLIKEIHKAFKEQYGDDMLEHYKQLPPEERIILIDDFDSLDLKQRGESFLKTITDYAAHTVCFASELLEVEEFINGRFRLLLKDFPRYHILPLNKSERYDLMLNWFRLEDENDTEKFHETMIQCQRKMDEMVANGLLLPFASNILPVLQLKETITELDLHAASQLYFTQMNIERNLRSVFPPAKVGAASGFLCFLAYDMMKRRVKKVTIEEFSRLIPKYQVASDNEIDAENFFPSCQRGTLLMTDGAYISFEYPYIYQHFAAKYLANHLITMPKVHEDVAWLAQRAYMDECANILLFLAHFSQHPIVVDEILKHAKDLYKEVEPIRLDSDIEYLNALSTEVTPQRFVERAIGDGYKEVLKEEEDAVEREETVMLRVTHEELEKLEPSKALENPINYLNKSLKVIQLLGQIVKNTTDALEADRKIEVANECVLLTRRTIGGLFSFLYDNRDGFVEFLIDRIKFNYPNAKPDVIVNKAKTTAFMAAVEIVYALNKRTSYAIGAEETVGTLKRMVKVESDITSVRLINSTFALDHLPLQLDELVALAKDLESNILAFSVLQRFGYDYLSTHRVGAVAVRSRIYDGLKIHPTPNVVGSLT